MSFFCIFEIVNYLSDITNQHDYSPFGMLLPNRHESTNEYRYGFQGQEKDDEIKGEGNSLNYKYRMHDPRIGRFFAVDPFTSKYPYYTPYSFSGNRVLDAVELEGLEPSSIKKRRKPRRINKGGFDGTNWFGRLFGMTEKGKYTRNRNFGKKTKISNEVIDAKPKFKKITYKTIEKTTVFRGEVGVPIPEVNKQDEDFSTTVNTGNGTDFEITFQGYTEPDYLTIIDTETGKEIFSGLVGNKEHTPEIISIPEKTKNITLTVKASEKTTAYKITGSKLDKFKEATTITKRRIAPFVWRKVNEEKHPSEEVNSSERVGTTREQTKKWTENE